MKLSKKIRNPLLSIETILENAMTVANNQESEQVIISRQDTCKMLQWIEHLKNNELEEMDLIERCLIGK
jgi:predicted mannosyl-3-phosphoglycerate phosphatase (HAD superfamily)